METDLKTIISLLKGPTKEEVGLVSKAYEFAQKAHEGQKRSSGEPYFDHLFATAKNIAELGMSGTTVAAGFLHDSIEDVGIDPETIDKEFGKEVRFIVEGVTKLGKVRYHGADRHNESMRKLFVAMSQDIRVLIVKLCDRLHNMETLQFVKKEKQERIARETLEIYAPIAYRLGIRKLSKKLEDTSFPYVYPNEYQEIRAIVKEKYDGQMESLEKFRKSVVKELSKSELRDFKTDYRVKGLYSLYKKYLKYNKDIEKIYDIAAMRILLKNQEDCYKTLGIIHANFLPLPGRIKDYIAFPKQNGYQGLHTTVFTGDGNIVEVQIKTEEMAKEAEYGIASHISYKSDFKKKKLNPNLEWIRRIMPSSINKENTVSKNKDVPTWIRDLATYHSENKDQEDAMVDIKDDFFSERIFVFTPKGDVVDLPLHSSAVDFAYSIHTDIGNHIGGVKINGKMTSIESELKSGDIVEIIINKNAKPNRKWLEHTKTTFAKKHIKATTDTHK